MTAGDVLPSLAGPDIAVAGLGPVRCHAESDQGAGARRRGGDLHRGPKSPQVIDDMIRGKQHDQGIAEALFQHDRSHGGGRCGVATLRLEHDRLRRHLGLAQLLGDDEAMLVVADDQRCREAGRVGDPPEGVLEHGELRSQRQELLRIESARQWPQPSADPAREYDGVN